MAFQDLFAAWEKAGPILRPKPLEYPWPLECTSALSEGALSCAPACARVCRSRMYRRDVAARAMGLRRAGDDARRLRAQVSRSSLCCQSPRATGPARPVPPPPSRTDWTRLVPPPVLAGHVSSGERSVPRGHSCCLGPHGALNLLERRLGWRASKCTPRAAPRERMRNAPRACGGADRGASLRRFARASREKGPSVGTSIMCVRNIYHVCRTLSCVSDTRAHLPGALTPGHI